MTSVSEEDRFEDEFEHRRPLECIGGVEAHGGVLEHPGAGRGERAGVWNRASGHAAPA